LIEILEKYLRIAKRKADYKTAYSELVDMYKIGELTNEEKIKRKNVCIKHDSFFLVKNI